jgi:hypothetical protein
LSFTSPPSDDASSNSGAFLPSWIIAMRRSYFTKR